ncbi:hypothetical protein GURASL_23670 [Geotalea uraniireducens]|uniref:Right handed beta helix domain-containing protein n=1 Tax=Geotalea uraniireducens TaxID=351604 RepID=A0ABN6VST5_9BACT|nr:right-handed parallel beta-helix repeat-containing protein [Geotalea uraniireducens]BDV43444.1 hypothetical protein GURASL_23670 [Geotalea uraniireducens]
MIEIIINKIAIVLVILSISFYSITLCLADDYQLEKVSVNSLQSLKDALMNESKKNKIIVINTKIDIDNVTIPVDRIVEVAKDGSFTCSKQSKFIILGKFLAPIKHIFYGEGQVIFGNNSISEDYPEWWGDDNSANQRAVNSFYRTRWRKNKVYDGINISIPNDRELVIDGVLQLPRNSVSGSVILKNSDPINGNNNIKIVGEGTLSGNKLQQYGNDTRHMLVHFNNCTNTEFAVKNVVGNYFPINISAKYTGALILVENSRNISIHDSSGTDYGRECFWLKNCDDSYMINLKAIGGNDSWSGFQFSGKNNIAHRLYSENAGASGVSFDCKDSQLDDVTVKNNRYFHGINFGHPNAPATNVLAKNLNSYNAKQYGISIVNGSSGIVLNNSAVYKAGSHCYNISANATNVNIENCIAANCGGNGINVYDAYVVVRSTTITNNMNYGVSVENGTAVLVDNSFNGNLKGQILRRKAGNVEYN